MTTYTVTAQTSNGGAGRWNFANLRKARQFARHLVADGEHVSSQVRHNSADARLDAIAAWARDESGRAVRVNA
jgi:hypothetical protein